jgi:hypothetical protein
MEGMVKTATLTLLAVLTALSLAGCAPDLTCDEEFSGGGDIVGATDSDANGIADSRWVVIEPCENVVSSPPAPVTSGSSPPKEASGDWCQNLSFAQDNAGTLSILNSNPWIPRLPMARHPGGWYDATLTYTQDNLYSFRAVLYDKQSIEIPGRCLTQQGILLTCDRLPPLLTEEYNKTDARLGRTLGTVNVSNMVCAPQISGAGCGCFFDMTITYDPATDTGAAGTWFATGDRITHFDLVGEGTPFLIDYRVDGNTLSMSAFHRRPLFGIQGLRTMKFARVNCNDGAQGIGETGVDCGYACPNPCP